MCIGLIIIGFRLRVIISVLFGITVLRHHQSAFLDFTCDVLDASEEK
jgi:hypothetical protein